MNTNPFAEPAPEDKHLSDPDAVRENDEDQVAQDTGSYPGEGAKGPENDEELVDEWGEDSFPSSDPPANY